MVFEIVEANRDSWKVEVKETDSGQIGFTSHHRQDGSIRVTTGFWVRVWTKNIPVCSKRYVFHSKVTICLSISRRRYPRFALFRGSRKLCKTSLVLPLKCIGLTLNEKL